MTTFWTRKCQECGHRQVAQKPTSDELTDAYRNAKCRVCKSEALDYGQNSASCFISPISDNALSDDDEGEDDE